MNQRQTDSVFSWAPILSTEARSGVGAEAFLTWRYAVLVIPPVSDRGETRPRVEASAIHPHVSKKKWFAVYTAARHEKFVQAQLIAKQIQSFLPLYTSRTTVEKRGSTGDSVSALSGLCLRLRRCERAASGSSNRRRRLYRGQRHSTVACR